MSPQAAALSLAHAAPAPLAPARPALRPVDAPSLARLAPLSPVPAALASARRRERLMVALGALEERDGAVEPTAGAVCERAGVPRDALLCELGSVRGCREARAQATAARAQARAVCEGAPQGRAR